MFEGKWLNLFISEWETPFLKEVSFTDGKCNWFLLLVLKSCNYEFVLKLRKLLNTHITTEKMHKLFTNKLLASQTNFYRNILDLFPTQFLIVFLI